MKSTEVARALGRLMSAGLLTACLLFGAIALSACSETAVDAPEDERTGYGMGGVEQDIVLARAALENKPTPWVLDTPEAAVRSYLAWAAYAYRIGESDVATPTMTPYQVVRVDAYNQSNLQKERLLDQQLESITFGDLSIDGETATLPAQEKWTYRYVSIKEADKTLEGPYTAEYETVYHLTKVGAGWAVDNIDVKALGEVK